MNNVSTVFKQDSTYPTYNRQNKDFAAWEKQENIQKREQKNEYQKEKNQIEKKQQDLYRINMVNDVKDYRAIDKIKNDIIQNDNNYANLNGLQLRNPLTQKLLINSDKLETVKDPFVQEQFFQGKKRDENSYNQYMQQTKDNQQLMQGKNRDVQPPQSEQQKQMQAKYRDEYLHSYFLKKNQEEKTMMQGKKRNDNTIQQLHVTQDEQKLMQGKKRIQENKNDQINKSVQDEQLFKSKNRMNNQGCQVSNDFPLANSYNKNQNESEFQIKEFQGKGRNVNNYNKYMYESKDQQQQFQGKKRVEQPIIPNQNDDLIIQKKKRYENNSSWKQSDSLQILMQSKKRDYVQNQSNQESGSVFQGNVNNKNEIISKANDNPYLNL